MTRTTTLACTCGQVHLTVDRPPIVSVECCCTSCRTAGLKLQSLPGAPPIVEPNGATHLVLYRKDRVGFPTGADKLKEHRLSPGSGTRRIVATCCNTAMFVEFANGHWLSLYGGLWPAASRPPITMRTMTQDAPAGTILSDDVPNPRQHTAGFYARLFGAWVAMGFRVPNVAVAGELHV